MRVIIRHWLFYSELFRALAKNCGAPLNDKEGAEAKNWKEGKAVRVVCKRLWEVWFLKKLSMGKWNKKTRHQTNREITTTLRRSDGGRAKRVSGFIIRLNVSNDRYEYKTQLQTCIKSYNYVLAFVSFLSSFFLVSFSFLVAHFTHFLYECFPLVAIIHYSVPFI